MTDYAFPGYLHTRKPDGEMHAESFPGLTKRELFAAMAMQGFCAAPWSEQVGPGDIATLAMQQADIFIAVMDGRIS